MKCALLSLLIGAALLAGIPAQAFWQSRDSNYNKTVGVATYSGPGDVVSGATAWYSCTRGYNAAYAAPGTGKACNVRRASDNTTQDIVILANGNFDVTSYNTFVGTDATCTGTIATTTLTLSSCASGTPHVNDPISGAGITQPAYITAIGTCASPPGTCTINASQTVGVGETITLQVAGFVTKAYDQTVGNHCASASCDVLQATAGNQPHLIPLGIGTLPIIVNPGTALNLTSANNLTPSSGVLSYSVVAERPSGTTASTPLSENGTANNRISILTSASTWRLTGGTSGFVAFSPTDGAFHAVNAINNGASSVVNSDGTETTGTTVGSTTAGAPSIMGGGNPLYGTEFGFWDNLAFTTGAGSQAALMCRNQSAFYGTTAGTNC